MFLCILFEILLVGCLYFLLKRNYILWAAILIKLTSSLCLYVLYFDYYQLGDIISYFNNLENIKLGQKLSFAPQTESRAIYFTKLVYPIYKLANYSSLLTQLNMGIINWISGLLLSYELIRVRLLPNKKVFQFIFLCFPSLMFWTSGMTKETVAITLVFSITSLILYAYRKNRELYLSIPIVTMAVLLYNFKYYQATITIPFLLLFYLKLKLTKPQFLYGLIGVVICAISLSIIHPYTSPEKILETIQSTRNFNLSHNGTSQASKIYYQDNLLSFIKNAPVGLFYGLFAPLKAWNLPSGMALVENIIFISLLFMNLCNFKSLRIKSIGVFCILFVVLYAVIAGISSPNYGTLSRIKVAYSWVYILLLINGSQFIISYGIKLLKKYRPKV